MPRTSYIKPNSKTQQHCNSAADTVQEVLERVHISRDKWLLIMFEMGCRLVEQQVHDEQSRKDILENVRYGFWSWWLSVFIQHDAMLMENNITRYYTAYKKRMLSSIEIDFSGENFLNI
jgi:hypothetical protein